MNEVRPVQSVTPAVTRPASSKGSVEPQAETAGKKLPEVSSEVNAVAETTAATPAAKGAQIEQAVASINEYVQSIQRDLHFTVDAELDRTVIKVVDGDSGKVIRQIPEEVVLDLARKLNDDGEFQLVNALG